MKKYIRIKERKKRKESDKEINSGVRWKAKSEKAIKYGIKEGASELKRITEETERGEKAKHEKLVLPDTTTTTTVSTVVYYSATTTATIAPTTSFSRSTTWMNGKLRNQRGICRSFQRARFQI